MGKANKRLVGLIIMVVTVAALNMPSLATAQSTTTTKSKQLSTKTSVKPDNGTNEIKKQAKENYNNAKKAYDAKDYTAAIVDFQKAYDLKPHPAVLKMIAECHMHLEQYAKAIALFEQLIDNPDYKNKEQVKNKLDTAKTKVGYLKINSSPQGAAITLDGNLLTDTTPVNIFIKPGDHTIIFGLESYPDQTKQITIIKGEESAASLDFSQIEKTPKPVLIDPFEDDQAEESPKQDQPEKTLIDDTQPVTQPQKAKIPQAFWAMAAITGIGLVSGTVFGTMALKDEKDYKNTGDSATKTSGERSAIIADISFGIAAGAAIAGTIILIVHKNKQKKLNSKSKQANWQITPSFGKSSTGLSTIISF